MPKTPGIDVSRWQGEVDWNQVASQGYRFAVIRATVGDYYTDPRFYENWRGAHEAGLLVSAYHVVKPKQPVDAQIDRFFDVLDERNSDLPLVLDVELADGKTPAIVTNVVQQCAALVEEKSGRKPIIYTGKWFWDPNVLRCQNWRDYDLWIANYGAPAPTLPADWSEWVLWQFSETGSVEGVSSRATDLNWFNGTYEDLLTYCKTEHHDIEGREVERAAAPALALRVNSPYLRVRSGPGIEYDHIGDLGEGDVIAVKSIGGQDVWVEFETGQWAAMIYQGVSYLVPAAF